MHTVSTVDLWNISTEVLQSISLNGMDTPDIVIHKHLTDSEELSQDSLSYWVCVQLFVVAIYMSPSSYFYITVPIKFLFCIFFKISLKGLIIGGVYDTVK